jgi:hypothetical protein
VRTHSLHDPIDYKKVEVGRLDVACDIKFDEASTPILVTSPHPERVRSTDR